MEPLDPHYYEGIAGELLAKLGRLAHFTSHRASIGAYHEAILRSALRDLLPDRFSLRTGFTFCGDPAWSRQFDILLVDESEPSSYFFKDGDFVVVHPDCVACAIEVKTTLNQTEFARAAENIYCLKKSAEIAKCRYYTPGVVFAFKGPRLTPYRLHQWYRAVTVPDDLRYYPETILCLTQGRLDCVRKEVSGLPDGGARFTLGEEEKGPKVKGLSIFLI